MSCCRYNLTSCQPRLNDLGGAVKVWQSSPIKNIIVDDTYDARFVEELHHHMTEAVANSLDPEKRYGIWCYNRRWAMKCKKGVKRVVERPREEWIVVPVPDVEIPSDHVRIARELVSQNVCRTRKTFWAWELSQGASAVATADAP